MAKEPLPRNWKAMRADRVLAMAENRFGRRFSSKAAAIAELSRLPNAEQRSLKKVAVSKSEAVRRAGASDRMISGMSQGQRPMAGIADEIKGLKKADLQAIAREVSVSTKGSVSQLRASIVKRATEHARFAAKNSVAGQLGIGMVLGGTVDQSKVRSATAAGRAEMEQRIRAAISKVRGGGSASSSVEALSAKINATLKSPTRESIAAVRQELAAARLSKVDAHAIAKATELPVKAASAAKAVTGRLDKRLGSLASFLAKKAAVGGRGAAGIALGIAAGGLALAMTSRQSEAAEGKKRNKGPSANTVKAKEAEANKAKAEAERAASESRAREAEAQARAREAEAKAAERKSAEETKREDARIKAEERKLRAGREGYAANLNLAATAAGIVGGVVAGKKIAGKVKADDIAAEKLRTRQAKQLAAAAKGGKGASSLKAVAKTAADMKIVRAESRSARAMNVAGKIGLPYAAALVVEGVIARQVAAELEERGNVEGAAIARGVGMAGTVAAATLIGSRSTDLAFPTKAPNAGHVAKIEKARIDAAEKPKRRAARTKAAAVKGDPVAQLAKNTGATLSKGAKAPAAAVAAAGKGPAGWSDAARAASAKVRAANANPAVPPLMEKQPAAAKAPNAAAAKAAAPKAPKVATAPKVPPVKDLRAMAKAEGVKGALSMSKNALAATLRGLGKLVLPAAIGLTGYAAFQDEAAAAEASGGDATAQGATAATKAITDYLTFGAGSETERLMAAGKSRGEAVARGIAVGAINTATLGTVTALDEVYKDQGGAAAYVFDSVRDAVGHLARGVKKGVEVAKSRQSGEGEPSKSSGAGEAMAGAAAVGVGMADHKFSKARGKALIAVGAGLILDAAMRSDAKAEEAPKGGPVGFQNEATLNAALEAQGKAASGEGKKDDTVDRVTDGALGVAAAGFGAALLKEGRHKIAGPAFLALGTGMVLSALAGDADAAEAPKGMPKGADAEKSDAGVGAGLTATGAVLAGGGITAMKFGADALRNAATTLAKVRGGGIAAAGISLAALGVGAMHEGIDILKGKEPVAPGKAYLNEAAERKASKPAPKPKASVGTVVAASQKKKSDGQTAGYTRRSKTGTSVRVQGYRTPTK